MSPDCLEAGGTKTRNTSTLLDTRKSTVYSYITVLGRAVFLMVLTDILNVIVQFKLGKLGLLGHSISQCNLSRMESS